MTDLARLTEVDIAVAGGGAMSQSISVSASQSNSSAVTQSATSSNSGRINATAAGPYSAGAAVSAEANNVALVSQSNAIVAANFALFRSW